MLASLITAFAGLISACSGLYIALHNSKRRERALRAELRRVRWLIEQGNVGGHPPSPK